MSIFSKLKSGIIIPKTADHRGTPCSFCPNIIHVHNEVNGVLYVASSKPICTVCRIMRKSKFATKMKSDAKVAHKGIANQKVEDVAVASQKRSSADSDEKKELMKRLSMQD